MRSLIILVLLGGAFILGITCAIDGRYDGRTLLAFIYIAIAAVLQLGKTKTS